MKKIWYAYLILFLISCNPDKKSTKFEQIIFHTSGCFGNCPTYHLEIDSKKNIRLFAEQVYKEGLPLVSGDDTAKIGYFTGIVNDTLFSKLDKIIDTIGIDSLTFNKATCCDGSLKTIIIYYNGKRKYLESMFPPEKAKDLITTLYEICTQNNLKRSHDQFKIED